MSYSKLYNQKQTSQRSKVAGKDQVKNNAGGYVFQISDWSRLDRFLVLGSDAPTYYEKADKLTESNAQSVLKCIKENALEVVNKIVDVSTNGKAPKNDPAIFALALVCTYADEQGKRAGFEAIPKVCRIGTHILQFVDCIKNLRGFGTGIAKAINNWYHEKTVDNLVYQLIKYQNRGGWSHRDVFRLTHPKFNGDYNSVAHWVVNGWPDVGEQPHDNESLQRIWAFERAKKASSKDEIVRLVQEYNLPMECVPTQWLNESTVWEALLPRLPLTATMRNLNKLTISGLLKPFSIHLNTIVNKFTDREYIRKSRLHPLNILVAALTYSAGASYKGNLVWNPEQKVVDALDEAFYLAFDNVTPTGKNIYMGLDVSGSMTAQMSGTPLSCRAATAALSLVTASVEKNYHIAGFCGKMVPLNISPKQRLDSVIRSISGLPFDRTDCSLPMLDALDKKMPVDTFIIYTDSETWAGRVHPFQALKMYRNKMGINAKLIVVGMTSTGFSIADPSDDGMLDVVGFSTDTPKLIENFISW